jgi:hypothetical protein
VFERLKVKKILISFTLLEMGASSHALYATLILCMCAYTCTPWRLSYGSYMKLWI